MKPITVLLADDHTLMRQGLMALLSSEADIEVLGMAENGRDALRQAESLRPKVAVLDVAMPELNGMDAARWIRKHCPETRVLALSMHADRRYVHRMLDSGATGYVLKNSAFDELATAIRAVAKGRRYFGSGLDEQLAGDAQFGDKGLTLREREVLQLIAEGVRTAEIGERLGISVKTVETHRRRIMEKVGENNVPALVKYALREGLIALES